MWNVMVWLVATMVLSEAFVPPSSARCQQLRDRTSLSMVSRSERRTTTRKKQKKRPSGKSSGTRKSSHPFKPQREQEHRPLVTDYDENRNHWVNRDRLTGSIGCEHFGSCSGCLVDANIANVDVVKSAKLFFSSTAVKQRRVGFAGRPQEEEEDWWMDEEDSDDSYNVIVPSALRGWRTQAKLVAAPKSSTWARDGCTFGLYQRGTHRVLPIPQCRVHHPSINRAVRALETATAKANTPAFQTTSGEGGLRYVQAQVERSTGRVCLTLVWNAEQLKETQPPLSRLIKQLRTAEPDLWHSLWCHCNNSPGNNIFHRHPGRWHHMAGPEFIREPIPVGNQGWLYFTPLTFRQGNMDGFDVLAQDVAKLVPAGAKVCELYAGVGYLGLTALLHHAQTGGEPLTWLRCSDENPANPKSFRRSMSSL